MKKTIVALLLTASISFLQAGETFSYPSEAPVFEITYPDTWDIEPTEQMITAGPASGDLSSVLMAVEGNDLETAIEGAKEGLAETFGEYTLGEPSEGQLNGMPVVFVNGSGQTPDGVTLNMGCAIFSPDGETFFMLFIFAQDELSEEAIEGMNSILQSVKAV